ncbi:hypothetical protein [Metabacillus fastidiosus]|uniref:Uncharacterized protein n=1 Tax=Metabacillus fastidiosus TaxID=1458 RepID=A0ABU6P458_9BACI|nr:hypothetical protein [Metabacillus fastidiosus]
MSIQLKFNDKYAEVYGKKYTDKMNYLAKIIMEYETGENEFNVFNFEAGLGKSLTVDKVLSECTVDWDNEKKFLVVKRFNDESVRSLEYIQSDFLQNSVAITHENWKDWQYKLDELQRQKVIFISHQRYIALCEDDGLREVFSKDRDILIVDEKVNFPVYTYNDKRYTDIFKMVPNGLRDSLVKVCKPLNQFIEEQQAFKNTNKVLTHKFNIHPATLKNFTNEIQIALDNLTIKNLDERNAIIGFVNELQLFYSSQCVYNSGNISTYNPKHRHWGLKNNIILDASGQIDGVYSCNPNKYRVIQQSRIVDHKECKFNIVKFNSSKTKVNTFSEQYFKEMAQRIISNKKESDAVLIVAHKDFAEKIYKQLIQLHDEEDIWIDKRDKKNDEDYAIQSIAIAWYGNLIGKNWAENFTQCWLISTPNIPFEQYLIHFLHYSDDKIGNKSTDVIKGRYKNQFFSDIQRGYIASEMYQSLKRIQRNAKPKGEFFIACQDAEIINMVLSQIKNAEILNIIELDFVKQIQEEKEKQKQENRKPDQVDRFIEYIMKLEKGRYKKSVIANELKISKINRVLSDVRTKSILNKKLMIHTREIEILR